MNEKRSRSEVLLFPLTMLRIIRVARLKWTIGNRSNMFSARQTLCQLAMVKKIRIFLYSNDTKKKRGT